ncbi:hypothetical protein [Vacuolonema iberomarrocanum]|uniref:hypothetical protein n=1 Tax=Vacuolonema iberomarrocanum TaxID=3454632 RepID=UPI001A02A5E3|nr:hypothetical protein [filamentous cyanobacterium LEGE 07170]
MKRPVAYFAASMLLVISLAACQSQSVSESDEVENPTTAEEEIADIEPDDAATSAGRVFPSDFEDACNGAPVPQAAAYEQTVGSIHPVYVFYRETADDSFIQGSGRVPEAWEVPWEDAANAQLVVCLTPVERTLNQSCEFTSDDDPDTYTLEIYDTVYEISVRAAQTGEELESTSLDLKADECPMFHMFTEGELVDQRNADFEQSLVEFVKPYVQPEA